MKTRTFPILSAVVLMSVSFAMAGVRQSAQFTVMAVDEESRPLNAAHIIARFAGEKTEGDTDTNGFFVVRAEVLSREGGFATTKDGYYASHVKVLFPSVLDGRCQPWNPVVTALVRKVVNPISMYVKKVETNIPVLDEPVGFDLVQSDWVTPHGKGKIADLVFEIRKHYVDFKNFDSSFDLTVTNALDGLQETSLKLFESSEFRLLRNAPIDGYNTKAFHLTDSSTNYFKPDNNQGFYFRARTETNELGQIKSALYGKIRGYIGFDVTRVKTGQIHFTYYLNPTSNDRNLEFDPKRNLFTNLGEFDAVSEP